MIINNPFIEFIIFIFAIITLFYLPGKFLLKKLKITLAFHEDIFLAPVLGLLIFTLLSYIFSWIQVRFLALVVILIIDFIAIKNRWFLGRLDKKHLFPLLIVSVFSIVFSLSMLSRGQYGDTIQLTRDDLWHLALINELKTNFPPFNPGFAGIPLKGYHFFYNFLIAQVRNIFSLSNFSLHFHFFPLLISFLWGFGVYSLINSWTKSKIAALFAVFITMFGGSFVFIMHLQGYKSLSLDSGFGMSQPIFSLWNPPFSISIVILLAALFAIYQYTLSQKKVWLIPLVLSVGLISMFKVYAGIILISGFIFFVFVEFLKKNFSILVSAFIALVLFLATYWVFTDRNAYLIWFPLWAPHKVLLDNLPWYGYEEKQYTYSRLSVIRGIVGIELYGLYIFLIGNLGTRLIGLLVFPLVFLKRHKAPSFFADTLLIMTLVSILIPLFFIQTGKVFEIIQMTWYFLFFTSLFAALGFVKLLTFSRILFLKVLLTILILGLTLPSAFGDYKELFKGLKSREKLSGPHLKSMQFLQSFGDYNSTVIEIPPIDFSPSEKSLAKWYNGSTPEIAAFANKRTYLNSEYIDFPGVDKKPRINFLKNILIFGRTSPKDQEYKARQKDLEKGFLENNIVFIYSPYPIPNLLSIKNMSQIFQNEVATIYKIEK